MWTRVTHYVKSNNFKQIKILCLLWNDNDCIQTPSISDMIGLTSALCKGIISVSASDTGCSDCSLRSHFLCDMFSKLKRSVSVNFGSILNLNAQSDSHPTGWASRRRKTLSKRKGKSCQDWDNHSRGSVCASPRRYGYYRSWNWYIHHHHDSER